jgi:hypothetical protein
LATYEEEEEEAVNGSTSALRASSKRASKRATPMVHTGSKGVHTGCKFEAMAA